MQDITPKSIFQLITSNPAQAMDVFKEYNSFIVQSALEFEILLDAYTGEHLHTFRFYFARALFSQITLISTDVVTSLVMSKYLLYGLLDQVPVMERFLSHTYSQLEIWMPKETQVTQAARIANETKSRIATSTLALVDAGADSVYIKDVYNTVLQMHGRESASLDLAQYRIQLLTYVTAIAKSTPLSILEEDISDVVDSFLESLFFFIEVEPEKVYFWVKNYTNPQFVLQYEMKQLAKEFDESPDDATKEEATTEEAISVLETKFGPVTDITLETFGDTIARMKDEYPDIEVSTLIIYNEATGTFEWNEDLIAS